LLDQHSSDNRCLVLNLDDTFMITGADGGIVAGGEMGLFARDTRYLSAYTIEANGQPWIPLGSTQTTHYSGQLDLTNRSLTSDQILIPEGTLTLTLSRFIGEGLHEDVEIINRGDQTVRFDLEVGLGSDFADLFEVKSHRIANDRRIVTRWDTARSELITSYSREDFHRRLIFRVEDADSPPEYGHAQLRFPIVLAPGEKWRLRDHFLLVSHERPVPGPSGHLRTIVQGTARARDCVWRFTTPGLISTNADVQRLYQKSVDDVGALRICCEGLPSQEWLPAAGAPWFMTIFGRDSLITSLQCMPVSTGLARGALRKLAEFQANGVDDWRDAEPGKIPHEIRYGELAHFKEVPHSPYYGSADATPLYLVTLHETWKWTGDDQLLRDYRDTALRCLEWIDRYGDIDGDGFQEYRARSAKGYENMGWKDAGDAVVYPDGSQVQQPKALCELQGYVFDAWLRSAEMFEALGETAQATALRAKAKALKERFEQHFWCEDLGFYAFGLDADKRPIRTIASNAGHCLWSGIASRDRAARVVDRLLEPDMRSGWGIRTLSAENPAYDPVSYHRGSVWPHDNGILALGFKRYGFSASVALLARDVCDAACQFRNYRLPELYGGVARVGGRAPVPYAGASSPQAWAAGSVFHLLQALLGLRCDAPNQRLYVDPDLPDWLPDVTLTGLRVGQATIDLRCWRAGQETEWDARVRRGAATVHRRSWQPWSVDAAPDQTLLVASSV
jgi:glycogen debranching enzyme